MYLIQALGELDKIIEENMNNREAERRARLMKMRDERLPDIKKQFEESQKRNFNSNFAEGGKDAALVKKNASRGRRKLSEAKNGDFEVSKSSKNRQKAAEGRQTASRTAQTKKSRNMAVGAKNSANGAKNPSQAQSRAAAKKAGLGVSVRKGEMVHHQRMLSQDVHTQATQHIIGVPVNKSRFNGYDGKQVTNAQLKAARPNPEAVRVIPIGGVGEFGIGKNMTIIEYKGEIVE